MMNQSMFLTVPGSRQGIGHRHTHEGQETGRSLGLESDALGMWDTLIALIGDTVAAPR